MIKHKSEVVGTPTMKFCSKCNEALVCGATQEGESCWCESYPPIMPLNLENDCLCEACLNKAITEKQQKYPNIDITEDFSSNLLTPNTFKKFSTKSVNNSVYNTSRNPLTT
jgi:hypothetical protein